MLHCLSFQPTSVGPYCLGFNDPCVRPRHALSQSVFWPCLWQSAKKLLSPPYVVREVPLTTKAVIWYSETRMGKLRLGVQQLTRQSGDISSRVTFSSSPNRRSPCRQYALNHGWLQFVSCCMLAKALFLHKLDLMSSQVFLCLGCGTLPANWHYFIPNTGTCDRL